MPMNLKYPILTLTCFFYFSSLYSQKENSIWNIGYNKAIDFNNLPPELIYTEARLNTRGYNSSICDEKGNLLFYSNGINVWDSNHQTMPNGNYIANGGSHAPIMHSLILPVSNKEDQYYLFSLSGDLSLSLFYSIIDMNLNGGKGDVHPDFKDILLLDNLTGILVATKGVCGSLWLITHELNSNQFFAFEINKEGIEEPIITATGSSHNTIFSNISFSSDSKKTAVTSSLGNTAELLEFNPNTGEFYNGINLPIHSASRTTINSCFSPDGSKLYIGESRGIFQYNLALSNTQEIIDSKTHIPTSSADNIDFFLMQRTPDEKIYIHGRNRSIDGILFPNLEGLDCTFQETILNIDDLNINQCCVNYFQNLVIIPDAPSQIDSMFLPRDTQLCKNTSLNIQLTAQGDSYQWQDGSTRSNYEITAPGSYWVNVQKGNCTFTDTLEVLPDESFIEVGNDTTLCENQILDLQINAAAGIDFQWQDGSKNSNFTVTKAGTYWVEATDSLCNHRDSIMVDFTEITVSLPNDTMLCGESIVELSLSNSDANVEWQDGSTTPIFVATETGTYKATISQHNCHKVDSITVTFTEILTDFLPNDTLLCQAEFFVIQTNVSNGNIQWQDGSTNANFLARSSGTYSAVVEQGICIGADSISIIFKNNNFKLPNDTILCFEESLLLEVKAQEKNVEWQDGSMDANFLVQQSGQYWAVIDDGDCVISDTINVQYENFDFSLGKDTTLCEGETLVLESPIANGKYHWQNGSSQSSFTLSDAGLYWLEVDKNGCVKRDSILIKHKICEKDLMCKVFIPNVFSPNNDGINDDFSLFSNCELAQYRLEIYDRWGNLLFSSTDEKQTWDGTKDGKNLDNGIYLVKSEYQLPEQNRLIQKLQTLTLVR